MNTLATTAARGTSARTPQASLTSTVKNVSEVAGRSLLSLLFLLSGVGKIGAYTGTAAYMSSLGVPKMIMFLKNVSIAGGFLLVVANGAGPLSLDRRFAR